MKLKARLGKQDHNLILNVAGDRISAEIDGRKYEIDFREPEENSYLLIVESRVYDCRVNGFAMSSGDFEVSLRGQNHSIAIADPKRLRSGRNSDRRHHGAAEIVAPMPGKIVRVLVAVGQKVEQGVGLVVVEAMKMQNEMKSPQTGVVVSVNCASGDTVNAGDVLAVVE